MKSSKLILIAWLAFNLIACGGGGGSGAPAGNTTSTQQQVQPVFASTYTDTPSGASIVSNLCTANSNTGNLDFRLAFADLNNDGVKDIVSVYWCSYTAGVNPYIGSVPNTLIVYLSQSNGSYVIGNRQLFGQDVIDIGGGGGVFTVADFNGDGKDDVGIAIMKEDGRANDINNTAWIAPQVVLMSQVNGTYSLTTTPIQSASGKVQAVKNNVNGYDFVYPTSTMGNATAYRWVNNNWQQINNYPPVNVAMTFFEPINNLSESTKVLSLSTDPNDGPASLQLQEKSGGAWSVTSKFITQSTTVNAIGWNGQQIQTSMATINGVRLLYATYEDACVIKLSPTSTEEIVLAKMTGFPVPANWDGVSTLDERTINSVSMLVPFSTQNGLNPIQNLFDVAVIDKFFTNYSCMDINNDGYTDVVINLNGSNPRNTIGTPIFYLNNKNGGMVKTDVENLPLPPQSSSGWASSDSRVMDMDGDGFLDLVYVTGSSIPNLVNTSIRIHKGLKVVGAQ
jgi:hypothetical protein